MFNKNIISFIMKYIYKSKGQVAQVSVWFVILWTDGRKLIYIWREENSEGTVFLCIRVAASSLFSIEFPVQEEDEQVDIHFGFIKHLHDGHAVILQLEEVLRTKQPSQQTFQFYFTRESKKWTCFFKVKGSFQ